MLIEKIYIFALHYFLIIAKAKQRICRNQKRAEMMANYGKQEQSFWAHSLASIYGYCRVVSQKLVNSVLIGKAFRAVSSAVPSKSKFLQQQQNNSWYLNACHQYLSAFPSTNNLTSSCQSYALSTSRTPLFRKRNTIKWTKKSCEQVTSNFPFWNLNGSIMPYLFQLFQHERGGNTLIRLHNHRLCCYICFNIWYAFDLWCKVAARK